MKRKAMLLGLILNIIVQAVYTVVMGWSAFLIITLVDAFNGNTTPLSWALIPLVVILLVSVVINIICATKSKKEPQVFAKYKALNIVNLVLNFLSIASLIYLALANSQYKIIMFIAVGVMIVANALVITSLIKEKSQKNVSE